MKYICSLMYHLSISTNSLSRANISRTNTRLSININVSYSHDVLLYEKLYCYFACNLQETKGLIKKFQGHYKFPILIYLAY